jgi:hypothetical protein
MKELSNQELIYVSGAAGTRKSYIDSDLAWISLGSIVALLFFGSTLFDKTNISLSPEELEIIPF